MKKRNLVIGLLVTLMVALSGATFAYWTSGFGTVTQAGNDPITVQVGTGDDITTTVSTNDPTVSTDSLVPEGYDGPGETDSIVINYTVSWDNDGANTSLDGSTATLTVSYDSLLVDSSAYAGDDINIDISAPTSITLDGTAAVTVTVSLNEPADQSAYDAIAGLDITFNVTFSVTTA